MSEKIRQYFVSPYGRSQLKPTTPTLFTLEYVTEHAMGSFQIEDTEPFDSLCHYMLIMERDCVAYRVTGSEGYLYFDNGYQDEVNKFQIRRKFNGLTIHNLHEVKS